MKIKLRNLSSMFVFVLSSSSVFATTPKQCALASRDAIQKITAKSNPQQILSDLAQAKALFDIALESYQKMSLALDQIQIGNKSLHYDFKLLVETQRSVEGWREVILIFRRFPENDQRSLLEGLSDSDKSKIGLDILADLELAKPSEVEKDLLGFAEKRATALQVSASLLVKQIDINLGSILKSGLGMNDLSAGQNSVTNFVDAYSDWIRIPSDLVAAMGEVSALRIRMGSLQSPQSLKTEVDVVHSYMKRRLNEVVIE